MQFEKSCTQNIGMRVPVSRSTWQARPALPGPILGNGVEFRFTIDYHLNSFFGCCWHAHMKKRSKLLNPRAAAWSLALIQWSVGRACLLTRKLYETQCRGQANNTDPSHQREKASHYGGGSGQALSYSQLFLLSACHGHDQPEPPGVIINSNSEVPPCSGQGQLLTWE